MKIEILIFLYIYVCCSVILFDFLFTMYVKVQRVQSRRTQSSLKATIQFQINLLQNENKLNKTLHKKMISKLRKVEYLRNFNECIKQLRQEQTIDLDLFIKNTIRELVYLSHIYKKRPGEQRALFAYVVEGLHLGNNRYLTQVTNIINLRMLASVLENFLLHSSVYVRENAFKAIVSLGVENKVEECFDLMTEHEVLHSEKLLADNLLQFPGDMQNLSDRLVARLSCFKTDIQCAIINYLRLANLDVISQEQYYEPLYRLLVKKETHKEIRYAIIRYFKKHKYEPVVPILIDFTKDVQSNKWEYAAISAASLASYYNDQVVQTLIQAAQSRNWYVRLNAAESLLEMGLEYDTIRNDIQDSYASDMLLYRDKVQRLKERKGMPLTGGVSNDEEKEIVFA